MGIVILRAHFDGEKIVLDEPFDMKPNTQLVVTVVPKTDGESDEEREDWANLARQSLARAYGDDEPEYTLDMIKEWNPQCEGR
jgi:hypothetical protein